MEDLDDEDVGPGALAVPQGKKPRVEHPDLPPETVSRADLFAYASLYQERSQQIVDLFHGLMAEGFTAQEAGDMAMKEVLEKIVPEAKAEREERLRLIRNPETRESIVPRACDVVEMRAMEEERIRVIQDPRTRSSIVPRTELEREAMEIELIKARGAAHKEHADKLLADVYGSAREKQSAWAKVKSFF
ncbi:MAG: hypothetical protein LBH53_01635 [Puniceicoccales bacterium]|nr:hypothetical protein [Puniceicoccales bacterium]